MPYTIFTTVQIVPETVIRPRLEGGHSMFENPEQPPLPDGTSIRYQPPGYSRFAPDPVNRTLLLNDPNGRATDADIMAAFPLIREPHKSSIRDEGAKRLVALATPYTAAERETWATQQREARTWLADNAASVPMISAMATQRGITVAGLVGKIMENVALFEYASGAILGQQQRLLDLIDAAPDLDAACAIEWSNE
jgi:hypothetical protein